MSVGRRGQPGQAGRLTRLARSCELVGLWSCPSRPRPPLHLPRARGTSERSSGPPRSPRAPGPPGCAPPTRSPSTPPLRCAPGAAGPTPRRTARPGSAPGVRSAHRPRSRCRSAIPSYAHRCQYGLHGWPPLFAASTAHALCGGDLYATHVPAGAPAIASIQIYPLLDQGPRREDQRISPIRPRMPQPIREPSVRQLVQSVQRQEGRASVAAPLLQPRPIPRQRPRPGVQRVSFGAHTRRWRGHRVRKGCQLPAQPPT